MSATAARSSSGPDVRAAECSQRSLDDHQRVADFVRDDGREPAERREPPRCAASRWKRAIESVIVLNVLAEPGILLPTRRRRAARHAPVRSPVAAISRMVAVMAPSGLTVRAIA